MTGDDLWDRYIESYGLGVTMTKDETIRLQAEEIARLRRLLRDGLTSNIPEWRARVSEALGE